MHNRYDAKRKIIAPHGSKLQCKSWLTEAAMRMLMNNLDPDVAEDPASLVASMVVLDVRHRNWQCFDKIIEVLQRLESNQTLLIQSGKPVGVFTTYEDAPRVIIANSNLVPHWATWKHFNQLDKQGLAMYGQMTAGSWIYIGSQGIVQVLMKLSLPWRSSILLAKVVVALLGLGGMGGACLLQVLWQVLVSWCVKWMLLELIFVYVLDI